MTLLNETLSEATAELEPARRGDPTLFAIPDEQSPVVAAYVRNFDRLFSSGANDLSPGYEERHRVTVQGNSHHQYPVELVKYRDDCGRVVRLLKVVVNRSLSTNRCKPVDVISIVEDSAGDLTANLETWTISRSDVGDITEKLVSERDLGRQDYEYLSAITPRLERAPARRLGRAALS